MIVLFEISPHKLFRDVLGFGWDLEQLERQGRLKIVFTTCSLEKLPKWARDESLSMAPPGLWTLHGTTDARSVFHVLTEGLQYEYVLAAEAPLNNGNWQPSRHCLKTSSVVNFVESPQGIAQLLVQFSRT